MSENGKITSIPCPPELLGAPDHYKALWLAIKAHCLQDGLPYQRGATNWGTAFPGYPRLAKIIAKTERQCMRIACNMQKDGWLRIINKIGRPHQFILLLPLTPMSPVTSMSGVDDATPDTGVKGTPDIQGTGPLTFDGATPDTHVTLKKKENIKEEKKSRSDQIASAKKHAEIELDSIDPSKFQKKYPWLEIPKELEACKNHHLAIQANYYGPKRFTDWNRVFHSWCGKDWKKQKAIEAGWQPETKAPKTEPPDNHDSYLDQLCEEFKKLPLPEQWRITEKAENILPHNLPKGISKTSIAAKEMTELCEIAIYCQEFKKSKPPACVKIKTGEHGALRAAAGLTESHDLNQGISN